ncbi:MBL fold metallo-hydrolase [Pelomyxa schiedti]|nr:MBL fold metallo-hydrolase [Pelomyxa schiedti]
MALWDGRFVVESLRVGALAANCVCVADVAEGVAAIFDPGDNAPAIVDTLLRRTVDPKIMGGRGAAAADASASPSAPSPPISATSAATTAASTAATAANTAAVPQSQNQQAEPSPNCDGVRVRVVMIVLTHSHMDHCLAVPQLKKMFPDAKIVMHPNDVAMYNIVPLQCMLFGMPPPEGNMMPPMEVSLADQMDLEISSGLKAKVLHTPGHSPGSVCFYFPELNRLLSGDTLFQGSVGRTDLPGGDMNALSTSIKGKLLPLPDSTIVIPGHGDITTVGQEKSSNPFVQYMAKL